MRCWRYNPITMPPTAPRLAGRRLLAVARALRTPLAGDAIARTVIRQMGLTRLRAEEISDAETRPVIAFRAAPRPPEPTRG